MALGELVLEDSGQITGIRVLSTDASGTTLELNLQLSGTIRGVGENTLWTYTMLQYALVLTEPKTGKIAVQASQSSCVRANPIQNSPMIKYILNRGTLTST